MLVKSTHWNLLYSKVSEISETSSSSWFFEEDGLTEDILRLEEAWLKELDLKNLRLIYPSENWVILSSEDLEGWMGRGSVIDSNFQSILIAIQIFQLTLTTLIS